MTNPKDKIGSKKVPLSLIPGSALAHTAMAMKNGADKYGAYNWRQEKVQMMIYLDAILRHTLAIIDGENLAEDSGVDHLAHIMAGCAILLDCKETGNLIDDRPTKGATSKTLNKLNSRGILDELAKEAQKLNTGYPILTKTLPKEKKSFSMRTPDDQEVTVKSSYCVNCVNRLESQVPYEVKSHPFDDSNCKDLNDHIKEMESKRSQYFYGKTNNNNDDEILK